MFKVLFSLIFCIGFINAQSNGSLVEVDVIKKGIVNPLEEFVGNVYFTQSSNIASQTNGVITKVNFEVGKSVKKGDVLVYVDSASLDASIKGQSATLSIAKIELENLQRDIQRYEALVESQTINQKLYDDTKSAILIKTAQIENIEAILQTLNIEKINKTIKAPFDGIIVDKKIGSIGEWLGVGSVIGQIIDKNSIDIMFNFPSRLYGIVDLKSEYDLYLDNQKTKTNIYAILPKGDVNSRTFLAKVKLNSRDLNVYEGMKALIKVPNTSHKESLLVHRDSVIIRFNQEVIFVNNNGLAQMIPVNIIGYDNEMVAIEAVGISEGMQVVVKGNERIFPNQPIMVK